MSSLQKAWTRVRTINSAYPDLIYVVVAVVMAVIGVVAIADPPPESDYRDPDALLTAFVVSGAGLLALSRRWPVTALAALVGLSLWQLSLNFELENVAFLNLLVMIFIAATRASTKGAIAVAVIPNIVLVALYTANEIELSDVVVNIFIFEVAFIGGALVRTRMNRIHQVETYATELSVQSDEVAKEAVKEERARIARELHDAVGHTLNLIVVQSGAAQRVREANPSAAYEALKTIENTGRQALGDMDRMLGILRDGESASETSALGPRPGLARLSTMLQEARSAGLDVELSTVGTARKLPVSIDLTAFRIIQESITNVIKHAPGSAAQVALEFGSKTLRIEISNGPSTRMTSASGDGGGRGLPGMKERVALFGGTIDTKASADGGFHVRVSLPLDEES